VGYAAAQRKEKARSYLNRSMFILPFIYTHTTSASGLDVHKLQVFLARGGTHLLSVDYPLEFCAVNDIRVKRTFTVSDIMYLEVEVDINTFYCFNEPGTQDSEVWRTYVLIGSNQSDPWNVNERFTPLSGWPIHKLMAPVLRNRA